MSLNETIVEDAALEWFGELGYSIGHGPQLSLGELLAERSSFSEVILIQRLREIVRRLNPAIPEKAIAVDNGPLAAQHMERRLIP